MADVLNYDDVCISELDAYLFGKMVSQVFILLYGHKRLRMCM